MSARTLHEIEARIEELDLPDQVRLLQYLAPKIAQAVLAPAPPAAASPDAHDALNHFRAIGNRLKATSAPGVPSLTQAVSEQRR